MYNLSPRVFAAVCRRLIASLVVLAFAAQVRAEIVVVPVTAGANRFTGRVTLPEGTTSITLQRAGANGQWTKVRTLAAKPGPMTLLLPAGGRNVRYQVSANVQEWNRNRFPKAFYQGRKVFGPSRVASPVARDSYLRENYLNLVYADLSVLAPQPVDPSQAQKPEEADIWKIAGHTAYFFNQYRGLQVIDLTQPEDPRLVGSLRLPAAGQDLYLLPAAEAYQDVLLVETLTGVDGNPATKLQTLRVESGAIRALQAVDIPGRPVDSRLVGRRLFLCVEDVRGGVNLGEWTIPADGEAALQPGSQVNLAGNFSTLAAGADWLAVAMTPPGAWGRAEVSAFRLSDTGLTALTASPVAVAGMLKDAYKIQWRDGVLTTIAQQWGPDGLLTRLENFSATGAEDPGALRGQLELARGESLHATRFAGDKAYIVTFFQKDPLFVVDLTDPSAPLVAGQLDVPGWSTHLEPLGDLLFSVGWDEGAVTASLFDVSDPAEPTLLRRLALTEGYGYSEANWDPQALKLIPGAGLALVPVNGYAWGGATQEQGVRLIDVDLVARDLRLRGVIPGRFEARRAALVGDAVVTLSQRVLATAAITDRDAPEVLADLLLAWPVNHVLPVGDQLLAVETGGAWEQGYPVARTSTLANPDALLAELDLPLGYVHDTALRDGRFYVLRETSANSASGLWVRYWAMPLGTLHLDVYDAAEPANLKLLSTVSWDASASGASLVGRLIWPRPNRPAVVLENNWWGYYRGPILYDAAPRLAGMTITGSTVGLVDPVPVELPAIAPIWDVSWLNQDDRPGLLLFDVTDPSLAGAVQWLPLATEAVDASQLKAAGDGLVVTGFDRWSLSKAVKGGQNFGLNHTLSVVAVPVTGAAKLRAPVDLPGSLLATAEISRAGFLLFTRTEDATGNGVILRACVYDGADAFLLDEKNVPAVGAAVAVERSLWYASEAGVVGLRLTDAGRLETLPPLKWPWNPAALQLAGSHLLGSDGRRLLAVPATGAGALREWTLPVWFSLDRVKPTPAGGWVVPCGDYGVEVLPPASE